MTSTTLSKNDFEKLSNMRLSPVHEHKGGWWFWNETWDKRIGSYITKIAAETGLEIYIKDKNQREKEKEQK